MKLDDLGLPILLPGEVWLVGAGPGDVGMLTLHAVNAIGQAGVIVHDSLVGPDVLALAPQTAEMVDVGKRGGAPSARQADIIATLVRYAKAGRKVVRLKGGDPFVFARGGEETLALAEERIPFAIVPGITSGLAALSAASIPATTRDTNASLMLATGHGADYGPGSLDWEAAGAIDQPLILYMAMKHSAQISERLMAGGRPGDTPVAVIADATTPVQKILFATLETLEEEIARAGMSAPAIIAIGKNVALAEVLSDWMIRLDRDRAGLRPVQEAQG